MKDLRQPLQATRLSQLAHLRARCNNSIRWTSTAAVLTRYQPIRETDMKNNDIADFVSSECDHRS